MNHTIELVLQQHAEEAALNWLWRDAAVTAPHYSLEDLTQLDNRLAAQLDGLKLGGEATWQILQRELQWCEPGEVFTTAAFAISLDDQKRLQEVLSVALSDDETSRAFSSALAWSTSDMTAGFIESMLNSMGRRPNRPRGL